MKSFAACALALIGMAGGASAAPLTFNFSQNGYRDGGVVTGSFVGMDLDADGQLSFSEGEILDAIFSFSGASVIPSFGGGLSDLVTLVYNLDGGLLGDDPMEGIGFFVESEMLFGIQTFQAGPAMLGSDACDGSNVCGFVSNALVAEETTALVQVAAAAGTIAPVPLPPAAALLAFGVAALFGAGLRRHDG